MISRRQGQASKAPSRGGVDVSGRLVLVSCQASKTLSREAMEMHPVG
jgi:hypothetical protein